MAWARWQHRVHRGRALCGGHTVCTEGQHMRPWNQRREGCVTVLALAGGSKREEQESVLTKESEALTLETHKWTLVNK